jgi:hypothetical protein
MTREELFLNKLAEQITTHLDKLPDNTEIEIYELLDLFWDKKNVSDKMFGFFVEILGCKFSAYDILFQLDKPYEYQPKGLSYFLDPICCLRNRCVHLHILRRYDALERQLQQLPLLRNEQDISYREFRVQELYLKRIFYLRQGEILKLNAAYENIWIKVIAGKGVVNKGMYEWHKKNSKSERIRLKRKISEFSFEDEENVIGSRDGLHPNHITFTNFQPEDFVIYVAYC